MRENPVTYSDFAEFVLDQPLYDYQREFIDEVSDVKYYDGPRQDGKTHMLIAMALNKAMRVDGANVDIFTPNQRMSSMVKGMMEDYVSPRDVVIPNVTRNTNSTVEFSNGSRISFHSMSSVSMTHHASRMDMALFDDASWMDEDRFRSDVEPFIGHDTELVFVGEDVSEMPRYRQNVARGTAHHVSR